MRKGMRLLGICGAYLFNQQPIQFIQHLRKESLKYNYTIATLCCSSDSWENTNGSIGDEQLVELIRHIPFKGMIVFSETLKNKQLLQHILEICNEKNIPVFSFDGELAGCYNMKLDNSSGFEAMVRHIVEHHGCRRVNMLAGMKNNDFSDERIAVFKKVLAENNIPIEEERIKHGEFWDLPARKAVKEFLNSPLPMPEAIVCANDSMAIAACAELRDAGYEIPNDILVTGFDGIQSGQHHFPVLSTCQPDFEEACAFIMNELEKISQIGTFNPIDHPISYVPLLQQSCGCKPTTYYNLNSIISNLYENNGDSAWHNISMNQLITDNINNNSIMELANILPNYAKLWSDHFRFACVKSALLTSNVVPNEITDMVTLLYVHSQTFMTPGTVFSLKDLIPHIGDIIVDDILIINILSSGNTVYGYNVEGYQDIDERKMQRANDFSFFLSYCINMILHNNRHKELTTELIKANLEVSMMALQDSMTGLYNRQGFFKEIEPLLSMDYNVGKYLYVFSIDMNRLKYINDTFGHADGDFALTALAHAITRTIGEVAICARFGGDEFVAAIISEEKNAYSAVEFSQRLMENIDQSEGIADKPYPVRASVGMNCLPITHSMNLESMIATADESMYEMKRNDKTRETMIKS